ncbi:MAG: ATP-binding protein, partial [Candidatus Marinimicrobia bacterium]|nr:ATP-binding protein [Candidatus Neomarinimicrobiota bacterium]
MNNISNNKIIRRFRKKITDKSRIFSLMVIFVIVTSISVGITIKLLYDRHLTEVGSRLYEMVQSQARLIEAIARYDSTHSALYSETHPEESWKSTIRQIIDAHDKYQGFGKTGEIQLAKQVGDNIVFIFIHQLDELDTFHSDPLKPEYAKPMRQALAGKSGTMIGLDLRGKKVLAAYEPVAVLDMGIVAKIEIREIQSKYMKIAFQMGALTLVLIFVGIFIFYRISNPVIKNLVNSKVKLEKEATTRKKLEKDLRNQRDQLEKTVKQRTKELETRVAEVETLNKGMINLAEDLQGINANLKLTTKKLTESNKELDAFSFSVSHDLRAPLRAINGFTNILIENYASKLDDEGKRYGSLIAYNATKMGELIDDLLAFSRMSRSTMEYSEIDIHKMVDTVYHELTTDEQRRLITFKPEKLINVKGDPNMLHQVWTNYMSNAIKFSSKKKNPTITVSSTKENGNITYCIKDNGVGFSMDYKDKLYGVFQRLHGEDEFPGTGIGLALVQRIIR